MSLQMSLVEMLPPILLNVHLRDRNWFQKMIASTEVSKVGPIPLTAVLVTSGD